jgi:hypothetical protein
MAPNRYVSDPIAIPAREEEADFARADLEFCGVDHSGVVVPEKPRGPFDRRSPHPLTLQY